MSIKTLQELSAEIHKAGFFESLVANVTDWNAALDARDGDPFDTLWVEALERLSALPQPSPAEANELEQLCEYTYEAVFRISQDADVAGYVCDDIGLLGEALAKGAMNEWLQGLLDSYRNGEFPC